MERCVFELLAFGFAEQGARASIDNLVQFVQVHVDPVASSSNYPGEVFTENEVLSRAGREFP